MVYQFKIPNLFPVDAQTAGEELNRIYRTKNRLDPKDVVNESRPVSAPLHSCFEWNDSKAAEKYRESQASDLIRCITVIYEPQEASPVEVRAYQSVQGTYRPIEVVIDNEEQMEELYRKAFAELETFRKKYAALKRLKPVFRAIDNLSA